MDRITLLNTIDTEHAAFEALIAPLNQEQLCATTLENDWSIKDLLAHIAIWEGICSGWLSQFSRGEIPKPLEDGTIDGPTNERIYQEYRDRSLQDIEELFQQTHLQFRDEVSNLTRTISEEDLSEPDRFAWTNPWPPHSLLAVIADNSYEHYRDHGAQIKRWLTQKQPAR